MTLKPNTGPEARELESTFGFGSSTGKIKAAIDSKDEHAQICPNCGENIDPKRPDCIIAGMCEICLGDCE